jgi:NADH-ubiquinone oxidoreductase chain 5
VASIAISEPRFPSTI